MERAADSAKPGIGRVYLSADDPCLVIGEGTQFLSEFKPQMQIMLPKSVNSALAEVLEVISDTELRVKREFGGVVVLLPSLDPHLTATLSQALQMPIGKPCLNITTP